jgi:hypothetical protein
MWCRAPLWLLAAVVSPAILAGQGMRGTVADGVGRPIANALVEVSTPAGEVVGRATTNLGGVYLVRLATAGAYHVRVRAIGYAQVRMDGQQVSSAIRDLPVISMSEAVPVLPELVALSSAGRCSNAPGTGRVMAPLLEAAAGAMEVMERTLVLGSARHDVEVVHRRAFATRRDSLTEADTTRLTELSWPVVSPGVDLLRERGFAVAPDGARGGRWILYGPDASVLFADWFLAEHCFTLSDGGTEASVVRVRFEPIGRRNVVRIAGELVLDRKSLALRELHFEHRNLPSHLPARSAGGSVHFVIGADGAWRPDRWMMRAPLEAVAPVSSAPLSGAPGRNPLARLPRVVGSVEVQGRVVNR